MSIPFIPDKTTQSVDIDSDCLTLFSIQVTQSELGCECRIVERHEDTHVHYEPRLPEHHCLGPVRGDVAVELLAVTVPGVMCNVVMNEGCGYNVVRTT